MASGFAAHYMTSATPQVPIGGLLQTGSATLPSGFLWADGTAVSRTTYANLFAAIGTAFGVGDGVTTFNLPDGRSRNFVGPDSGAGRIAANNTRGASAGEETHVLTVAELASHTHTTDLQGAHTHGPSAGNFVVTGGGTWALGGGAGASSAAATSSNGDHTHTAAATGSNTAHNNLQPYQVSGGWVIRFI